MAARISGMLSRALVTAMVGRMSMPLAISSAEDLADMVAERVEGDDPARLGPLRVRADRGGRMGVGEVRAGERVQRPRRDGERPVERVGAAMGADDVAVGRVRHRADDRAALLRVGGAPADREAGGGGVRLGMGGEPDMGRAVGRGHRELPRLERTGLPATLVRRALVTPWTSERLAPQAGERGRAQIRDGRPDGAAGSFQRAARSTTAAETCPLSQTLRARRRTPSAPPRRADIREASRRPIARAGPEGEDRHVLAGVVGAAPGRVVAVVGGDDGEVARRGAPPRSPARARSNASSAAA